MADDVHAMRNYMQPTLQLTRDGQENGKGNDDLHDSETNIYVDLLRRRQIANQMTLGNSFLEGKLLRW